MVAASLPVTAAIVEEGRSLATRMSRFEANKSFLATPSCRDQFKQTTLGTNHFIQELQAAREEIERDGRLHRNSINTVLVYFGSNGNDGGPLCCFLNAVISAILEGKPVPSGAEEMSIQFCKERLLKILDEELCKLRIVKGGLEEIEEDNLQATIAAASVPNAERYERLLRYETAIERQFYRAAHELERRQCVRQDLTVPPPVAVDVDVSQATS